MPTTFWDIDAASFLRGQQRKGFWARHRNPGFHDADVPSTTWWPNKNYALARRLLNWEPLEEEQILDLTSRIQWACCDIQNLAKD